MQLVLYIAYLTALIARTVGRDRLSTRSAVAGETFMNTSDAGTDAGTDASTRQSFQKLIIVRKYLLNILPVNVDKQQT